MIIVELRGGLGNQLFQYAAGLSLAKHHNVPVKVDVNRLLHNRIKEDTKYKFELENIKETIELAADSDISGKKTSGFLSKVINRLQPPHQRKPYKESHFHFDRDFFKAPADTYLQGYWQSEKYFFDIRDYVREQFQIREEKVAHLSSIKKTLSGKETVALHVRRKDYLKPGVFEFHGVLDETYYKNAIAIIEQKVVNPYYIVFSDDLEWVKTNFNFNTEVLFIDSSTSNSPITDFHLISFCKHQVIANSTFSWWAAYLNLNPQKVVIAPKKWFNQALLNTKDIIPESWIRI